MSKPGPHNLQNDNLISIRLNGRAILFTLRPSFRQVLFILVDEFNQVVHVEHFRESLKLLGVEIRLIVVVLHHGVLSREYQDEIPDSSHHRSAYDQGAIICTQRFQ